MEALDTNEQLMASRSKVIEPSAAVTSSNIQYNNEWWNDSSTQARFVYIKFTVPSFFKSAGVFPSFLAKNGVRVEVEFQNPVFCFYNNYLGVPHDVSIPISASTLTGVANVVQTSIPFTFGIKGAYVPFFVAGAVNTHATCSGSIDCETAVPAPTTDSTRINGQMLDPTALKNFFVRFYWKGRPVSSLQNGVPMPYFRLRGVSCTANATTAGTLGTVAGDWVFQVESPARQAVAPAADLVVNGTWTGAAVGTAPSSLILSGGTSTLTTPIVAATPFTWTATQFLQMVDEMRIWYVAPEYAPAAGNISKHHPTMVPHTRITNFSDVSWNYTIDNPILWCRVTKPSADVLSVFRNQFMSEDGIQWPLIRQSYYSRTFPDGSGQVIQLAIPIAVRSLRCVYVIITDPLSTRQSTDNTSYNFPSESSFMMRGLKEASLTIGAQTIPGYKLRFRSDFTLDQLDMLDDLGNMSANYNPGKLHINSRDYLAATGAAVGDAAVTAFGSPQVVATTNENTSGALAPATPYDNAFQPTSFNTASGTAAVNHYRDTSRFVLAFPTMKIMGDFLVGLDTSQGGALMLNLDFVNHATQRPRHVHVFGQYDALVNLSVTNALVERW